MRILHLLNHVKITGNGIVNATIDLACEQNLLNHEVAIASEGGEYQDLLNDNGIHHFQVNQNRSFSNMKNLFKEFDGIIKHFKPDIVHAHMITGAIIAKVCNRGNNYHLVTTVHNSFEKKSVMMCVGERVIAVSNSVKDELQKSFFFNSKKIRIVKNGTLGSKRKTIDTENKKIITLKNPSILIVAGMYKRKGVQDLIEAFNHLIHKEANLYIVGDGPDLDLFKTIAEKGNKQERIHFEGFSRTPNIYMKQADIFVLPSHKEPFGLVLTEAREAGCAIIASNTGGIPEALDYGNAGILITPNDVNHLKECLSNLLNNDEELIKWKKAAKENLEKFSVHRVCEDTLEVYNELLENI